MIGALLKTEIEHTFTVIKARSTSEELVFLCPQPGCGDGGGNRSVNLKTSKTFCWRCNIGGDFLRWAARLGYRFENEGLSGISPSELLRQQQQEAATTEFYLPVINDVKLPVDFARIVDEPKSVYTRLITSMAERKHLFYDDLAQVGVGFTRTDPYWEPFALFPVFEYGRLVYFQGRTYRDVPGEPTKRFPSRKFVRYGASNWIYNIDEIWQTQAHTVILVESILNVLSLKWKLQELGLTGVVAACVFKHSVSKVQYFKLMRYANHLQEVCLMFDADALKQSWHDAARLATHFKVTVAEMSPGPNNSKQDPNDDVAAAMEAFAARQPYTCINAQAEVALMREKTFGGSHVLDLTKSVIEI